MITQTLRSSIIVAAAAAFAAYAAAPAAHAGFHPPLHFTIDVSGVGVAYSDAYEANMLFDLGGGQFAYEILGVNTPDFDFNPTGLTIGSGAPTNPPAGIWTGFAFQNLSGVSLQGTITFTIMTSFPTPQVSAPWETNVAIGLSGNTTVNTFGGMPLWEVFLDPNSVGELFPDSTLLTGPSNASSTDFGTDLTPVTSMMIKVAFEINPGGQVSFNGNFTMIPVPGSLALLALGGVVAVGRRRRTPAA